MAGRKRDTCNKDFFAKPSTFELILFYTEELQNKFKNESLPKTKWKPGIAKQNDQGRVYPMLTIIALLTKYLTMVRFRSWGREFQIPSISLMGTLGFGICYILVVFLTLHPEPTIPLDTNGLVIQKKQHSTLDTWHREEVPIQTNYTIPPELYPDVSYDIRQPMIIASSHLPMESYTSSDAASPTSKEKVQATRKIIPQQSPTKRPPSNGIFHVVRKRESLSVIASNYRVNLKKVIAANPYINPNRLMPGDKIFVPGAAAFTSSDRMISPFEGARTISGFGYRKHPIGGNIRFHSGIDITAPNGRGTPIRAVLDGVVISADKKKWRGGKGLVVELRHKNGMRTLYAHNSKVLCKVGQYVKQGTPIALVGSTGYTTGPHLHFEVWKNNKQQDPENFLKLPNHPRRKDKR